MQWIQSCVAWWGTELCTVFEMQKVLWSGGYLSPCLILHTWHLLQWEVECSLFHNTWKTFNCVPCCSYSCQEDEIDSKWSREAIEQLHIQSSDFCLFSLLKKGLCKTFQSAQWVFSVCQKLFNLAKAWSSEKNQKVPSSSFPISFFWLSRPEISFAIVS